MNAAIPILGHLTSLADATRCRLLRLLTGRELAVADLCAVVQLPQSTVSRHLKVLVDDGWVRSRPDGTSRLYSPVPLDAGSERERLWALLLDSLADSGAALEDERRLASLLESRQTLTQRYFASAADGWDRVRDELFGRRFHLAALPALLDEDLVVGDLGCGTGQASLLLAPYVRRIVAVDESPEMLEAARSRLREWENVEVRPGRLEELPLRRASLDLALLFLVLHHVADPEAALAEVARVTRPGGKVLMVDMLPHAREAFRLEMGHVWLGFSRERIEQLLRSAGFVRIRWQELPADAEAKGPALFVATAVQQGARKR